MQRWIGKAEFAHDLANSGELGTNAVRHTAPIGLLEVGAYDYGVMAPGSVICPRPTIPGWMVRVNEALVQHVGANICRSMRRAQGDFAGQPPANYSLADLESGPEFLGSKRMKLRGG